MGIDVKHRRNHVDKDDQDDVRSVLILMRDKVWHLLQNNQERYESIGSAVAIKIPEDRYLLISAEHVLSLPNICCPSKESFSDNPEYYLLEGQRSSSKNEDWAYLLLDKTLFIQLSEAGYNYSPTGDPMEECTFAGFPITKNKTKKTKVQNRPYSYSAKEVQQNIYNQYNLDRDKYIAVHYDAKNTFDSNTRQSTQFPDPHGMSGGGVFNMNKELVGIITDQSEDGKLFW